MSNEERVYNAFDKFKDYFESYLANLRVIKYESVFNGFNQLNFIIEEIIDRNLQLNDVINYSNEIVNGEFTLLLTLVPLPNNSFHFLFNLNNNHIDISFDITYYVEEDYLEGNREVFSFDKSAFLTEYGYDYNADINATFKLLHDWSLPFDDPIIDPLIKPLYEPTFNPITEPIVEPISYPMFDPVIDPIVDPVIENVSNTSLPYEDTYASFLDNFYNEERKD